MAYQDHGSGPSFKATSLVKLTGLLLWLALLAATARAQNTTQTLALWTFENNPVPVAVTSNAIGPIAPESGTGQLRGWHAATNTVWNSTVSGNGSLRALNANRWAIGDYFEVEVPVPGSGRLGIEWHHMKSSMGPQQFSLQYSTDGSTFLSATNYTLPDVTWSTGEAQIKPESVFTHTFPDGHPANAQSNITFRLAALSAPGGATATSRIDNVKITRNAVYFVTVAEQQVEVQRWGTGPKGVIFFSHSENLAADFRANADLVQELVGAQYSVFTWTYPAVDPFNRVSSTLSAWVNNQLPLENRLLFPGVASSVLSQIRALTGLQDFCLVGNSLGAGVVMSDYDTLVGDSNCKTVLISPTEAFIPLTLPASLENTLMVSDPYSASERWLRRPEDREFCARNTNLPLPSYSPDPGHIIIRDAPSIEYAFSLVGYAFQPPGTVMILAPEPPDAAWGNSSIRIGWFASLAAGPVRLDLFRGGQFLATVAESIPNNGNFWWRVPDTLPDGTDYSLRLSSISTPVESGGLETLFSIRTIRIGEAVGAPHLSWTTGGQSPWYGQAKIVSSGGTAVQSGKIADNESTWCQTTLTGPGTLSFDWRVSSERDYDFLVFSFPGTSRSISGDVAWTRMTMEIPAGEVVVQWAYLKDENVSSGEDAGWIDSIKFIPDIVDGLPGVWWDQYFGTTEGVSAGADADGDSFTNAQEFAFGADPTVGNASLLTAAASGGNLVVTWLQRSDVTYNVQSTASLATTGFANDGTVSVTDGSATPTPPAGYTRKQFSVPATNARFYRVTATVPSP
jgi:hypothetical protein